MKKKPETKNICLPYLGDSEFAVMNIARELHRHGGVDGNQVAVISLNAFVSSCGLGTHENIYVEILPSNAPRDDSGKLKRYWLNAEEGLRNPGLAPHILESLIYCMKHVFENANTDVGFWTDL